ncbi:MAG: PSD1 domain-containing protein [Planctomyces sp.]|nr:PSD1 domain-containing protein [Planctomyces sp.]
MLSSFHRTLLFYRPLRIAEVLCITWLLLCPVHVLGSLQEDDESYFRERVEPVLRRRCFACHSHTAEQMEGGLALDWKSGWEIGGTRGAAIKAGDPDGSLLIQAIRHMNPELKMPDDRLPDEEIETLAEWVRRGAFDPRVSTPNEDDGRITDDWWSLKPLVRPTVPESVYSNPIDAFISDRLKQNGRFALTLQANERQGVLSESADRRTLIRRLTVDLHGMLPAVEDVGAFVSDASPHAVDELIERLLASPRYGERWARHWMDTIHYADSHGFEHDVFRPNAWRFRDYLIESLNNDKPWGQLIREQLAADALYPNDSRVLPAIGFLGAGTYDHSAAATAPKSFENLDRDDMVTQTMAAFVSTTANCARCHAHKFDPISQEDYYSLQAVFAGIGKGEIPYDADPAVSEARQRWQTLKAACDALQQNVLLNETNQQLVNDWENSRDGVATWKPLEVESFVSVDAAQLQRLPDGSILSKGPLPEKETTTVTGSTQLSRVTAVRLDVLPHEMLPGQGPGRAENGNLHLNDVELRVFRPNAAEGERLKIRTATADFDQEGWTIQHAIDGNLATAWGIHPQEGKPHFAVFELETPLQMEPGMTLHILLRQIHGRFHIIGRFQLSVTDADPQTTVALSQNIVDLLEIAREQRTPEQQTQLSAALLKPIADAELRKLPLPQKLYAAATVAENERGVIRFDVPREIRILKRGDVEQPGELVGPGALSALKHLNARFDLPPGHHESARRVALAEWLASPENPLTWRSIANRVWHYHFGRGLCDTPSDFGRMGGTPSHPELLDWLACEIRDSGGSLKGLHRLICSSRTWQQTSSVHGDLAEIDPENRLLGRMSRQRLDADSWRDSVMLVSGRLDFTMGGPGISQFSSRPGAQLTPILDYSQFDWDGPGGNRRSIYRVVWRGIADPLLEPLDFPDLGLLAPVRGFSASPLQALTMMNNRFVLHHVEHMAKLVEAAADGVPERVRFAVRLAWQREPDDYEMAILSRLAENHGMVAVCRVLLNSNEFLFVD